MLLANHGQTVFGKLKKSIRHHIHLKNVMSQKIITLDGLKNSNDRKLGSNSVIKKYLDHIEIHFRIIPDVLGEWKTLGTLNEGERPDYTIFVPLCENSGTAYRMCIIAIYPDGNIQYLANANAGYVEYLGFVSFKL